jgi:hypothetical protein
MYRNVLYLPAFSFATSPVTVTSSIFTPPGLLARLFILAEKYQILPLQNDIIDAFLIYLDDFDINHRIPASVIQYVWSNTISEDCKLREFLIDYVKAEYTYFDVKKAREEVTDEDFWFRLSRDLVLTLDCLRDAIDNRNGVWNGALAEEFVVDDLRGDVCCRWHRHDPEEMEHCEVLKKYVLVEGGEGGA